MIISILQNLTGFSARWVLSTVTPIALLALMAASTGHATSPNSPKSVPAQADPLKIVVSIKPLALIAAAITDGISEPELLLPPGTSPHNYSLRPSDIRKLTSANLVFWIGGDMESFLVKVLNRHVEKSHSIPLMEAPDIRVEGSQYTGDHDHSSDHNHGSHDPHIWLNPENAITIARTMTQAITQRDKTNTDKYQKNLNKFIDQVRATDQANKSILQDYQQRGFFVFHDAWGYFANYYGLNIINNFTVNPEQAPGARHMVELRNELANAGKTCLFREPQFQPAYLKTMINNLDVRVDILDPLASNIKTSPDAYPRFLGKLATTIRNCLSASSDKPGNKTLVRQ